MSGRVIITFKDNHKESLRCKSESRAKEIADKRRNIKEWKYYENGERIPQDKKTVIPKRELTLEEMEMLIRKL